MTYIIEIGGKRYEARMINMSREIKVNGEWLSVAEFTEHLIYNNDWNSVFEMAKFGEAKVKQMPEVYGKMLNDLISEI